jgi:glycosyltransferase involved in cell wall biosynthesis
MGKSIKEDNIVKIGFCLDIKKKDVDSGKHKFFIRLARELVKKGIKIDNKNPDIYILLAGYMPNKKAKLNVLRLDGLIMNTRWDYKSKNKEILKSIKKSDALIYQSNFCKKAYEKFLGIKKEPFTVILNGASPDEFLFRNPKNYFLANCKWRPHKRLKDIIESYKEALSMGLKSDIIITGNVDYKISHPRIKFVGWRNHDELKILLSEAIVSIHLTWLDWCPNSMVEAIVAGCPVIYTKSGGQTELGKNSGIAINDKDWNFNLIDLYSPPPIDKKEVAESMLYFEKNKKESYLIRNDLYISNVCDKYLQFFNKLLEKK